MATQLSDSQAVAASPSPARSIDPHSLEHEVHARLSRHPDLVVKSLVVRRIPNGVCLEGRIEVPDDNYDLFRLIHDIPGLDEVVNHLVINHAGSLRSPAE